MKLYKVSGQQTSRGFFYTSIREKITLDLVVVKVRPPTKPRDYWLSIAACCLLVLLIALQLKLVL